MVGSWSGQASAALSLQDINQGLGEWATPGLADIIMKSETMLALQEGFSGVS